MKLLVLEPFSGASGDMIIGSLLDLGIDESKVADAISVFDLSMEVKEVEKRGIRAKKVQFVSKSNKWEARRVKSYEEIVKTIANSGLRREIIDNSLSIFDTLADAESKVHGEPRQRLVFHELGAMDTIGDIVVSSMAFLDFQADCIASMPISVGTGFVETEDGLLPVPAPATVEILKRASLLYQSGPFASLSELLTPTGAAILAQFVQQSVPFLPPLRVKETGYGAGSRDLPMPNVLRASVCEADTYLLSDEVEVLETNVDNVTGELMGNLIEVLMADGAKEVAIVPTLMKKGRSGHIIQVITAPKDVSRIAHRIMAETGSLGVRVMQVRHRFIANREQKRVLVRVRGVEREVCVKIGRDARGDLLNVAAEFEDAKRVARELGVPLKDVMAIVEDKARKTLLT
ncbi:MAG: nickel pincer cofactor biosynthesis protein LarC [Halobacteriota archaeon]